MKSISLFFRPFPVLFAGSVVLILGYTSLSLSAQSNEVHDHNHDDHAEPEAHSEHSDKEPHDDHTTHEDAGHTDDDDLVEITPAVLEEMGIELGRAGPAVLHETVTLPGEIQFNRERLAYVTPRLTGTVQSVEARLADAVRKGDVLARLESTDTLRPFEVAAPLDGVIVAYDVTPGQTVEAGTALFTVANLETVWADLRIFQRDMGWIHEGQEVRIVDRHGAAAYTGTIAYIAPTIDVHTRTGLARVLVDNDAGVWKPGQFIEGIVTIEDHPVAIGLPRTAFLPYEGETVVFVQTPEGFRPRPVRLGHRDEATIEVLEGLRPGEVVALTNVISLKAELGKASFGGHAGHAH